MRGWPFAYIICGLAFTMALLRFIHGPTIQVPSLMRADDGFLYVVEPGETLGDAMARGEPVMSVRQEVEAALQEQEPSTNCVADTLEHKPPDTEACQCYQERECGSGGNEPRSCKRHCKKHLCKCCEI